MLQEFTAFERLPVTVTEADLLRDIQIHLPLYQEERPVRGRGVVELIGRKPVVALEDGVQRPGPMQGAR